MRNEPDYFIFFVMISTVKIKDFRKLFSDTNSIILQKSDSYALEKTLENYKFEKDQSDEFLLNFIKIIERPNTQSTLDRINNLASLFNQTKFSDAVQKEINNFKIKISDQPTYDDGNSVEEKLKITEEEMLEFFPKDNPVHSGIIPHICTKRLIISTFNSNSGESKIFFHIAYNEDSANEYFYDLKDKMEKESFFGTKTILTMEEVSKKPMDFFRFMDLKTFTELQKNIQYISYDKD
jgi:hypothetical protein